MWPHASGGASLDTRDCVCLLYKLRGQPLRLIIGHAAPGVEGHGCQALRDPDHGVCALRRAELPLLLIGRGHHAQGLAGWLHEAVYELRSA